MLCRTMLGKLPLVSTSFANLTTDESLEAVSIATDYEKLIPILYFYFPIDSTSTTDSGPESFVQRSGKETPHRARMRFSVRRSAVFETLFHCFRRTSLEGGVSLARGA
jgi:hypothetical protein